MVATLDRPFTAKKPRIPASFNSTRKKLAGMFIETVDRYLEDSGGAFGYSNDRNRKNPPWDRPMYSNEFRLVGGKLDIINSINTFEHLCDTLVYVPEDDEAFQAYYHKVEEDWEPDAYSNFVIPSLNRKLKWGMENIYNSDNSFDQDFLWYYPDSPKDDFTWSGPIILKIHGGCDIRSGYSEPVLFHMKQYPDNGLFWSPTTVGEVFCPHCKSLWTTDDGQYWEASEQCPGLMDLDEYPAEEGTTGKRGMVVLHDHNKAFCPVCMEGELE